MTRLVAGMVLCLIASRVNASAQTRTPSTAAWEVEFNVGGAFITTPKDGAGSVPGGTRLANVGLDMWQVPSWYFDDGAALLTQFPLPRTTPLDSVLLGKIAQQERTATYGLRAARRVTNRLHVEGSVDYWRRFPTISVASTRPSSLTTAIRFGTSSLTGPATLSGPAVRSARTFEAEGLEHHVKLTAGLM